MALSPNAAATDGDTDAEGRVTASVAAYDAHAEAYGRWSAPKTMEAAMDRFCAEVGSAGRVLDAGCGSGRDLVAFAGRDRPAVGIDLSPGLLDQAARWGTSLARGDLRALPFAGACFDGVWSCASLVHLDPAGAAVAMGEWARVLRPGASLFVTVKAGGGTGGWAETEFGRRWFFYWAPGPFAAAVEAAGFVLARASAVVSSGPWLNVFATRAG